MQLTALYTRVSTQEQMKEGYSIHAQKERLEAYAKAKGYEKTQLYTDGGLSGGSLERPALQQLILDIEKGLINCVIVYKLDRISRSQKDTLYLVQDIFNKNDVDFISLEENIDTSTPMGMLMIGVLSAFAELERSTITQRSLMGREERAKEGYYHGGGNYEPLGYNYVNGELVVNESEKEIIKDMFSLYVNGNSLNTTSQKIWDKYPDRIKSKTIVRDALKNTLYIGKVSFNGKEFHGRHQPIIDEKTFYEAQRIRKKRSVGEGWTNKRKGLFVGKIHCAHCGAKYARVVSGTKKYRYVWYRCYSRVSSASRYMVRDKSCTNKSWKEEALNDLIINQLKTLNFNTFEENKSNVNNSIKSHENELNRLNAQIEKLIDLYTFDTIDRATLDKRLSELNKRKNNVLASIEVLKEESEPTKALLNLKDFDWDAESDENKMRVIDELIDRIEIDNDNVKAYFTFN